MSKLSLVRKRAKQLGIQGEIEESTRPSKKFMIRHNDKWIHFGAVGYEDYLDHHNEMRRENYLKRAKGIREADGSLAWLNPDSPNYYAVRLLW